jgi:hypothetical protein
VLSDAFPSVTESFVGIGIDGGSGFRTPGMCIMNMSCELLPCIISVWWVCAGCRPAGGHG